MSPPLKSRLSFSVQLLFSAVTWCINAAGWVVRALPLCNAEVVVMHLNRIMKRCASFLILWCERARRRYFALLLSEKQHRRITVKSDAERNSSPKAEPWPVFHFCLRSLWRRFSYPRYNARVPETMRIQAEGCARQWRINTTEGKHKMLSCRLCAGMKTRQSVFIRDIQLLLWKCYRCLASEIRHIFLKEKQLFSCTHSGLPRFAGELNQAPGNTTHNLPVCEATQHVIFMNNSLSTNRAGHTVGQYRGRWGRSVLIPTTRCHCVSQTAPLKRINNSTEGCSKLSAGRWQTP